MHRAKQQRESGRKKCCQPLCFDLFAPGRSLQISGCCAIRTIQLVWKDTACTPLRRSKGISCWRRPCPARASWSRTVTSAFGVFIPVKIFSGTCNLRKTLCATCSNATFQASSLECSSSWPARTAVHIAPFGIAAMVAHLSMLSSKELILKVY